MTGISRTIEQAGAIPVRSGRICLVTSRHTGRWVVPKGKIERGKTAERTAVQEAWEEAGVRGTLAEEPVGTYRYQKFGQLYRVTLFLMHVSEVHSQWPEMAERKRRWIKLSEAVEQVEKRDLRAVISKVVPAGQQSREGSQGKRTASR